MSVTRRAAEGGLAAAVAAAAGGLLFFSSPGPGLHVLAWFGLTPLLLVARRASGSAAFVQGCICGLLFHALLVLWMLRVDGMNLAQYATLVTLNSGYYGIFALTVRGFERRAPAWSIVALPTIWVVLEYIRSHLSFLASPWGVLGYSQYTVLPVARLATITSVYGVSFLLVAVNVALADLLQLALRKRLGAYPRLRWVSLMGLTVLAALTAGANVGSRPLTPAPSLRVGLVQGNFAWDPSEGEEGAWRVLRVYEQLTREVASARPTLVAWPSGVLAGQPSASSRSSFLLASLARETQSWLLVGASRFQKLGGGEHGKPSVAAANAALLYAPSGKRAGSYEKIRLLPFAEFVPLRGWLRWPSWIVSPDGIDVVPGKRRTVFRMGDYRFGVSICWENFFADDFRKTVAQGLDFMVSMTDESFTDSRIAHRQMLAVNVFRAIENRIPIVRTAHTGFSAEIGADGRIRAVLRDPERRSLEVAGTLVSDLLLSASPTFYTRHGNVFVHACFAGLVPLALLLFVHPRRDAVDEASPPHREPTR